jgi:hypothetical protein
MTTLGCQLYDNHKVGSIYDDYFHSKHYIARMVNAKFLTSRGSVIASAAKQSLARRAEPIEIASSLRSSQ